MSTPFLLARCRSTRRLTLCEIMLKGLCGKRSSKPHVDGHRNIMFSVSPTIQTLPAATTSHCNNAEAGGVTEPAAGAVVIPHGDTSVRRGSTFHEGSPLIKDLLRKTSRLDQQVRREGRTCLSLDVAPLYLLYVFRYGLKDARTPRLGGGGTYGGEG